MFKFRKIASVLVSAVMVSSTVALAAAANYPAPFVKNGMADVAIVYGGADAANTDLLAAADISTSLQTELAKQTASGGSTSSGTTVSGGDYVKLSKSSDKFNLGNDASTVFGTSVTNDDLSVLLADGTYNNDNNDEFEYEQRITLGSNLDLTHFADSSYEDKAPTVGVMLSSGAHVLNYSLDFTTDPDSDVTGGDLVDLETTTIKLLGREYFVSDVKNGSSQTYLGKVTLLDTANSAMLAEGETKTLAVGTNNYDVSISFIGETSVKLSVNGQVTNSLSEGQTFHLGNGIYVAVKDILYSSKDTGVSKVEFSIGSGKIEITSDTDIKFNDDSISGLKGFVYRGSAASGKEKMDKIVIQWSTDDREFVTPDSALAMPGFKSLQLSMAQFFTPVKESVKVTYDGDESIELRLPIKDGDAVLNILHVDANGKIDALGRETDEVLRTSGNGTIVFNATSGQDKYFVASWNTTREAESYLLSASVTEETGVANRTTIKNEITGKEVCKDKAAGTTCNIGSVSLNIANVYKLGSVRQVDINAGSGVTFNTLYSKEGLKIALPVSLTGLSVASADGEIYLGTNTTNASSSGFGHNATSFYLYMTEENKDGNLGAGTKFNFTIQSNSDNEVEVLQASVGAPNFYEVESSKVYESYVVSDLATKVVHNRPSSAQRDAEVEYHGSESYGELFLTDMSASVSGGSSGSGSVKTLGQVIVMDSEVSSVSDKNLVVVGGSCINSVAASLLGSSSAICGADFTAKTNVASGQFLVATYDRTGGKVATLVAGYNAGDTTNAAKYVTTQTVDTTVGKKYVGTSATSATLQTA